MNIKTIFIASTVVFAGLSAASAADAVLYEKPAPVISMPVFSWAGGYFGGQIGYGWGKSNFTDPNFSDNLKPDGFLSGVYAGYNFSVNESVVLGVDGDVTYNNLKDGSSEDLGGIIAGSDTKLRWSGSVRARAGYAIDRFLPYIAGGVAFGGVKNSGYLDFGTDYFPASQTKTLFGWAAGAGVDYAATDNLILRFEYRYTDYGHKDFGASNEIFNFTTGNKLKTNEIRVGVAYKF